MGSQSALSSRAYFALYVVVAIISLCSACALWYRVAHDAPTTGSRQDVNILSTSATQTAKLTPPKAVNAALIIKNTPLHEVIKHHTTANTALQKGQPKQTTTAEALLFNDQKMQQYLLKQQKYSEEEKEKEDAFRMKQSREATVAEKIAKQAASKYNILTFPDTNMKKLKDFEEKSFAGRPEAAVNSHHYERKVVRSGLALAKQRVPVKESNALTSHNDMGKQKMEKEDVSHFSVQHPHELPPSVLKKNLQALLANPDSTNAVAESTGALILMLMLMLHIVHAFAFVTARPLSLPVTQDPTNLPPRRPGPRPASPPSQRPATGGRPGSLGGASPAQERSCWSTSTATRASGTSGSRRALTASSPGARPAPACWTRRRAGPRRPRRLGPCRTRRRRVSLRPSAARGAPTLLSA